MTIITQVELTHKICPVCGCCYAIPMRLDEKRREDGETFFCPNGHTLTYKGEIQRLREELKKAQTEKWQALSEMSRLKQKAEQLEKRIANGVCPCCKRSFLNLKRHLKTKHPDWPVKS